MIYLDNAATTSLHPDVLEAMMPYMTEKFGNPGSAHRFGREAANAVAHAREQVASFLHCKPEQIIFTSGATEANNMVFRGLQNHLERIDKKHIITSMTEHKSVLNAVGTLEMKDGFGVTYLPSRNNYSVSTEELIESITDKTGLVSVMYVNNEVGFANPVKEIGEICKQNNLLFHTDCVQAAGYYDLDVDEIGCDFMTISSHKIHGPKGIGALYVRNPELLTPMIYGGSAQEFGLRGGTENVAAIVGFGMACEIETLNKLIHPSVYASLNREFRLTLQSELRKRNIVPFDVLLYNVSCAEQNPKILSITIKGVDAGTLQMVCSCFGTYISTGSACNSQDNIPSHVLKAIGMSDDEARSTIRVSFSYDDSVIDIQQGATAVAVAINQCKNGVLV